MFITSEQKDPHQIPLNKGFAWSFQTYICLDLNEVIAANVIAV